MANSGKVAGLERLLGHSDLPFEVPEFRVVDIGYFDFIEKQRLMADFVSLLSRTSHIASRLPSEFNGLIAELCDVFAGQDVIVRSSSLHEDTEHSFAGIYESFNIGRPTPEKLAQAIFKIYSSMNSQKARQYRAEHGITKDRMEIIVQKFVEPKWSGVMYTSNPTYPDDLSIEFVEGRNRVVEGKGKTHIIEYDKKTKCIVFKTSRNPEDLFDTAALAGLGISLEERIGPSDIEFVVAEGNFHLVQSRKITDLQFPLAVEIPEYRPEQFLGRTNVKRGVGKVTLPVVVVPDIYGWVNSFEVQLMAAIRPKEFLMYLRQLFDNIITGNNLYGSGYILVTSQFYETNIQDSALAVGLPFDTTIETLTSHKKAILTFNQASVSSHAMAVARERGIAYVGFESAEDIFESVKTGDILSIYFVGREALVYKEEVAPRSIREMFSDITYTVERRDGRMTVTSSSSLDLNAQYISDLGLFLKTATGQDWTFEQTPGSMGGNFRNEHNEAISVDMLRMVGKAYVWDLHTPFIRKSDDLKPLPPATLNEIFDKYEQHLTH